jgi:uncharacterized protein
LTLLPSDPMFFALAAVAVIFAGVSKGGFGSGAAFAAATILALVIDPGTALALMLPLLMLIDVASLRPYWKRWSLRDATILTISGLPGVALGAWLYRSVDADAMRLLIGAIAVGFVIWEMWRKRHPRGIALAPLPVWAGGVVGLVAGFSSFVSHAGGPPAAVYLLSRRLDKTEFQATTVLVFWFINIAKFVPYAYLGMFTWQTLWMDVLLAPFALFGTWLGVRAHFYVSPRLFFGLTYVLLVITGSKLIWDGLT